MFGAVRARDERPGACRRSSRSASGSSRRDVGVVADREAPGRARRTTRSRGCCSTVPRARDVEPASRSRCSSVVDDRTGAARSTGPALYPTADAPGGVEHDDLLEVVVAGAEVRAVGDAPRAGARRTPRSRARRAPRVHREHGQCQHRRAVRTLNTPRLPLEDRRPTDASPTKRVANADRGSEPAGVVQTVRCRGAESR